MLYSKLTLLATVLNLAFSHQVEQLSAEPTSDNIPVTLVEANIFGVATTIAESQVCCKALVALSTGDNTTISPAIIKGFLQTPGVSLETVLERQNGQLVCTRATVDELIRGLVRIDRDAPASAELHEACQELEEYFQRLAPGCLYRLTHTKRWLYALRAETKPSIPVSAIPPKKLGGVLNTVGLMLHKRRTQRAVSRLLGHSAVLPGFLPLKAKAESGAVFGELFSDSVERRLTAPARAVPALATDTSLFFTVAHGQQETPALHHRNAPSFNHHNRVIEPLKRTIVCPDGGSVMNQVTSEKEFVYFLPEVQTFITDKRLRHILWDFRCRGPPATFKTEGRS